MVMEAADSRAPILDNYHALVSLFSEFLTVAVHTILYERDIYPRESFINTRKYNHPVRQNRHPKVCAWIQDAIAAVEAEMLKCTVAQTSVIIYSSATNVPLERYVFSTDSFPIVPLEEIRTPFEKSVVVDINDGSESRPSTPSLAPSITTSSAPAIDITSQFPGVLTRLSMLSDKLKPLPEDCSFTIAIELRDRPAGVPPIGWPMPWVASEPGMQPSNRATESVSQPGVSDNNETGKSAATKHSGGQYRGGVRTTPIRAVGGGSFALEVWVEEGKEKLDMANITNLSESSI